MRRKLFLIALAAVSASASSQTVQDESAPANPGLQTAANNNSFQPYYKEGKSMLYENFSYSELIAKGFLKGSYTDLADSPARRKQANRLKAAGVLRTVTAYFTFLSYMWRGGSKDFNPGKSQETAVPAGESCYVYATPVSVRRYHVIWNGKRAIQQWGWYRYYGHEQCVNPLLKGAPAAYVVEVITIPEDEAPALDTPCPETIIHEKITYANREDHVNYASAAPVQSPSQFSPVHGSLQQITIGSVRTNIQEGSVTYAVCRGGLVVQNGTCSGGPPNQIGVPGPVQKIPVTSPPNAPGVGTDAGAHGPGGSDGAGNPGNGVGNPIQVQATHRGGVTMRMYMRPAIGLYPTLCRRDQNA